MMRTSLARVHGPAPLAGRAARARPSARRRSSSGPRCSRSTGSTARRSAFVRDADAAEDDRRRELHDAVVAVPLRRFDHEIGAHDEAQLPVGVLRAKVLDRPQRAALAAELLLDATRSRRAAASPSRARTSSRGPRRTRAPSRTGAGSVGTTRMRRDVEPREHHRDREHVREVRRIEAPSEHADDRLCGRHASPCTRIFVARWSESASFCVAFPAES